MKTGFVLSRCLRSSSALEGYHAPFNDAMAACGHRAGLDWMEASSNEFDFRWCVRALRSSGIIPSWVRMFNLALIDEVWDLAEALFEGGGALALPGWRRTRLMALLVRQGFYYGKKALKMDSPKPVRTRRTAEDVDALMAQGVDASAETLVQVLALNRGLYPSPSDAAGFIESVVVEERGSVRVHCSPSAAIMSCSRRFDCVPRRSRWRRRSRLASLSGLQRCRAPWRRWRRQCAIRRSSQARRAATMTTTCQLQQHEHQQHLGHLQPPPPRPRTH